MEFLGVGSPASGPAFDVVPVAPRVSGEIGFARALRRFTRRPPPNNSIIIANSELHAWAARRWTATVPLVFVSHGPTYPTLTVRRPFIALLFRRVIEPGAVQAARRIIAIDRHAERYFRGIYPNASLQRIPLAIDTEHFAPVDRREARTQWGLSGEFALLFVGRLAPEKNPGRAVSVYRGVLRSIPEAVLLVAGTGSLRAILENAAEELGPTRIRLLGDVPRSALPSLYSAADGLLLTSDIEQFPTVMLESLACGTPVFSTDVGDVSLVLTDPATGAVCPPDPDLIARRIIQYAPEERGQRANRVLVRRKVSKEYDWSAIGPRIERVLREAAG